MKINKISTAALLLVSVTQYGINDAAADGRRPTFFFSGLRTTIMAPTAPSNRNSGFGFAVKQCAQNYPLETGLLLFAVGAASYVGYKLGRAIGENSRTGSNPPPAQGQTNQWNANPPMIRMQYNFPGIQPDINSPMWQMQCYLHGLQPGGNFSRKVQNATQTESVPGANSQVESVQATQCAKKSLVELVEKIKGISQSGDELEYEDRVAFLKLLELSASLLSHSGMPVGVVSKYALRGCFPPEDLKKLFVDFEGIVRNTSNLPKDISLISHKISRDFLLQLAGLLREITQQNKA